MPLPKRPRPFSPDEVRITRDGDVAILEPADPSYGTTRFILGAEKLKQMSDAEILAVWNEGVIAVREHAESLDLPTTEIPPGRPQLKYHERADQWSPG